MRVLLTEHSYELCRSFNFSVALAADSRERRSETPFSRIPRRAGSIERRVTLYLFRQHFIPRLRDATAPTSDPELRAEPSQQFDKSTPLGRDNCFSGLPPSSNLESSVPPLRWPIDTRFGDPFCPLAAEDIASVVLYFSYSNVNAVVDEGYRS